MQGPFLYLRNGWTGCAQTWYAISSRPYGWLAQLGWGCQHARAHVPFLYFSNGCTNSNKRTLIPRLVLAEHGVLLVSTDSYNRAEGFYAVAARLSQRFEGSGSTRQHVGHEIRTARVCHLLRGDSLCACVTLCSCVSAWRRDVVRRDVTRRATPDLSSPDDSNDATSTAPRLNLSTAGLSRPPVSVRERCIRQKTALS